MELVSITETKERFSEVDSMQIVWHGNYVKFVEDGREAFGLEHGLGYMDVYKHGYMTPIVKVNVDYKRQVKYGDTIIVKTKFEDCDAAKIKFSYKLFRASDNKLAATADSIQVFTDEKGELQLTNPPFFVEWKKKMKLR